MSENRSRFKIKKGDIEVEYEGNREEVAKRYADAFAWVSLTSPISPPHVPSGKSTAGEPSKPSKRGGVRSNVISRAIDGLIGEHWMGTSKKVTAIVEELKRRGVKGVDENNANEALKRRVGKTVDRIKDKSDGKWIYSERETES
jgi:hypothetical protein